MAISLTMNPLSPAWRVFYGRYISVASLSFIAGTIFAKIPCKLIVLDPPQSDAIEGNHDQLSEIRSKKSVKKIHKNVGEGQ